MGMEKSEIIFKYFEEFFILESDPECVFEASSDCQEERWALCKSCVHYDAPQQGCKHCGCYLPLKIKDQWGECPIDKWAADNRSWKEHYHKQVRDQIIKKNPELENYV